MFSMPSDIPSINDLLKSSQKTTPPAEKAGPLTSTTTKPAEEKPTGKTEEEKTAPEKFEERMGEIDLKQKEAAAQKQAASLGVPYIGLKGFAISPDALSLIPEDEAKELRMVCFLHTGPELRIAATDPTNEKVQELAFQLGERNKANVAIYFASEDSIAHALTLYKSLPKIKKIVKGVQITEKELKTYQSKMKGFTDVAGLLKEASITDVVSIVVAASLQFGSSDIHIEAEEKDVKVRFRVDGILQDIAELPKESWKKIISRIKLISGIKINVSNRPQDGRFTIFLKDGNTDVRVSALPTTWGESVVMRLLKPSSIKVEFEQLGFRPKAQERLDKELRKPHGMIITTGPTGSGKTTTLYAILRKLNQEDVKIITLEDPIEYKLKGINQSQVDASKKYTFAGGLRSILRQDPDIVMVGEIRDLETAETAVNAALTGHLLLSTIHTNDAAGAIPRFLQMGVKPFMLAQALNAVMGQRLVRRLCQECKVPATVPEEDLKRVMSELEAIPETSGEKLTSLEGLSFFGPGKGCDKCNGGYKGRLGIYEVLLMNDAVEEATREGGISESKMREIAAAQGMVSMFQDGLLKTIEGLTSIEEIFRVALS